MTIGSVELDDMSCAPSTSEPGLKTTMRQAEVEGYGADGPVNTSSFQMTWGPTGVVHAYIPGIGAGAAAGQHTPFEPFAGRPAKGLE